MAGFELKVSPVTGKFVQVAIFEVTAHLEVGKLYFVTLENYEHDGVAIRSFDNNCGITGWFKKTDARGLKVIKERQFEIFVKPITSHFITKLQGKREFEFRQKVSILFQVNVEADILWVKDALKGFNYCVFDDYPW